MPCIALERLQAVSRGSMHASFPKLVCMSSEPDLPCGVVANTGSPKPQRVTLDEGDMQHLTPSS